jgi:hypothetical protein
VPCGGPMTLQLLVWSASHVLLVGVLAAMASRKLYRRFPVFFAYIAEEIVQFVVLFTMAKLSSITAEQYTTAYTWGLAVSTALRFGVVYEIAAHLFRSYDTLSHFGKPFFRWMTVGLLLAALALLVYTPAGDGSRMLFIARVLDRTASVMQCGLVLGLFLISAYLGLSWRSYLFGIALGLGFFSSVELAASAIRAETGSTYNTYLNFATMGTYHFCVLLWLVYLLAPERSPQYKVKTVPEHDLESWNQELQRLIHQ